jgi:hypothetical protein
MFSTSSSPRLVCGAIASFLDYVAADPSELRDLIYVLEGIEERLVEIQGLAWTSDFGKE